MRPIEAVMRPIEAVMRPIEEVMRPIEEVKRPIEAVKRPSSRSRPVSRLFPRASEPSLRPARLPWAPP
jgi:hypothetical protein